MSAPCLLPQRHFSHHSPTVRCPVGWDAQAVRTYSVVEDRQILCSTYRIIIAVCRHGNAVFQRAVSGPSSLSHASSVRSVCCSRLRAGIAKHTTLLLLLLLATCSCLNCIHLFSTLTINLCVTEGRKLKGRMFKSASHLLPCDLFMHFIQPDCKFKLLLITRMNTTSCSVVVFFISIVYVNDLRAHICVE